MPQVENQVLIPSELPEILRQFTAGAITTQPSDLLEWSCTYFNALKNGEPLPIKPYPETVGFSKWAVLTPEIIRKLHQKLGGSMTIQATELIELWKSMNLPPDLYRNIMTVGNLSDEIEWLKFLALSCNAIGVTMAKTLKIACEVLSSDHESGLPRIPFTTFQFLYTFLADVDGEVSESQVNQMLIYLQQEIIGPDGLISPNNFMNNPRVFLE
ncbi:ropporin-1-like [Mixophyes fleayi]|uniref:ropporin-1-like n=1 Tax=Mixophyes fleayi TaxID=3061075 RepID=UPI003F4DFA0D